MSAISIPSLWRPPGIWTPPQRGAVAGAVRDASKRIRASFCNLFSNDGKEQENSDGKANENLGGKTIDSSATNNNCCCGCRSSADCSFCNSGSSPTSWTVSWSGINLCTGTCIDYQHTVSPSIHGILSGSSGSPGTFSGTSAFPVTQDVADSAPCSWIGGAAALPAGYSFTLYFDSGPPCSSVFETGVLPTFGWTLSKISGGWSCVFRAVTAFGNPSLFSGALTVTDPYDCYQSLTFTNQATTCPDLAPFYGYGGTAVFTPCF